MLKNHISLTDCKREKNKINNLIRKKKNVFSKIIVMKTNKTLRLYGPCYIIIMVKNYIKQW